MPPRKKTRPAKTGPVSRVHRIASLAQWEAMLDKAGDRRLVVAQFYQAAAWACRQMRPYFVRMSALPQFRRVIFAEVDVDEARDVAEAAAVQRVPTYQCWLAGEVVSATAGGQPDRVQQMVRDTLAEHALGEARGPVATALRVLGALAVVAGALAAVRLAGGGGGGGGGGEGGGSDIVDLKKRAAALQARLRAVERAGRAKQANALRKMLAGLQARLAKAERAAAAAQGREDKARGKGGGGGGGAARRRGAAADPVSDDEDYYAAAMRRKRAGPRPAVYYTDEEEG